MCTDFIQLVEGNPDDEALTPRALARNNILDETVVARGGAEAREERRDGKAAAHAAG